MCAQLQRQLSSTSSRHSSITKELDLIFMDGIQPCAKTTVGMSAALSAVGATHIRRKALRFSALRRPPSFRHGVSRDQVRAHKPSGNQMPPQYPGPPSRAEKRLHRAFRRMPNIRRITPAKRRRLIRPTWFRSCFSPIRSLPGNSTFRPRRTRSSDSLPIRRRGTCPRR
jgi:hypothetical protein